MREETVQYFTEREDEFANLLIQIGTRKNVAKALVFLASTQEATTGEIEHGADMRQPEVSLAMKCLTQLGFVKSRDGPSANKGRPVKIYTLAKPLTEILEFIEKGKQDEIRKRLERVKELGSYVNRE